MLAEFVDQALATAPSRQEARALITRLAGEVAQLPQIVPDMDHTFVPGIYVRSCIVPAGAVVVGKIHLHEHVSFVDGDITVFSQAGHVRLTGAHMVVALPGEQRSVFAHAPTIWRTVHANPTNERDLAKLEAMLIADDYEALDLRLSAAEVPA